MDGRIVAGPHVRNACRRHLDDLKRIDITFDAGAANHVFGFFEDVLRLSEGQFEGRPFRLEPSQCFIIGSLFGWKRKDGTRRFRRAYIEEGKGNGKSPLAGGIGLFGLVGDGEAGAQIYAAASHQNQAKILFADAVKMVRQSPVLNDALEFSGGVGREFNIAYRKQSSFFRPVSRETGRTGSGPRPYFVLADEVHELPDRTILETLERGFKFRREPLLLMITNSGSDRNSIAWEEHEHAVKVAAGNFDAVTDPSYVGEIVDDTSFAYVCALDSDDDPLTDPSCWVKANPLLGVTITDEYLGEQVAQAIAMPGKLNGVLRLHFCTWTDAEVAWMVRSTVEPALADFDWHDYRGERAYIGLDLSQNRDLTAKATVVQTGIVEGGEHDGKPTFDAWVEAWTPRDTMQARELRDKAPYSRWVAGGFLQAPAGENISLRHVAQSLVEDDRNFDLQMIAYDRYAFRRLEEEVTELGASLPFVEHPQGGVRRGKPNDGMGEGLWMPASVRAVEELLLERRLRLLRSPLLVSAIMSAVVDQDRWGNHWLAKERAVNKIDAAVALCMAVGAALAAAVPVKQFQMMIL